VTDSLPLLSLSHAPVTVAMADVHIAV